MRSITTFLFILCQQHLSHIVPFQLSITLTSTWPTVWQLFLWWLSPRPCLIIMGYFPVSCTVILISGIQYPDLVWLCPCFSTSSVSLCFFLSLNSIHPLLHFFCNIIYFSFINLYFLKIISFYILSQSSRYRNISSWGSIYWILLPIIVSKKQKAETSPCQ